MNISQYFSAPLRHPVQYLHFRKQRQRIARGDAAALNHLIDFLRDLGVIPIEKSKQLQLTPVDKCVQEFEKYLREERGLSNATVINYVPFIHDFLKNRFGKLAVKIFYLVACDVVNYVQHKAKILHRKRAKLMTSALRSFLKYAIYIDDLTLDLAAAIPTIANWSMTSIPGSVIY